MPTTPPPDPREMEIRAALAAHPDHTDRVIAHILGINRWSRVSRVRAALAAGEAPPPPPDPALICPHPDCGFVAKTPGGLGVHEAASHRRPAATAAELAGEARVYHGTQPEPVALLADDVPAASDAPPPTPPIVPSAVIVCGNCGKPGTPAPSRPDWCKACATSPEAAAWRAATLWACGCGGPFARSTQQPDRCIRCSGEYDRAARRHRTGAIFAAAD